MAPPIIFKKWKIGASTNNYFLMELYLQKQQRKTTFTKLKVFTAQIAEFHKMDFSSVIGLQKFYKKKLSLVLLKFCVTQNS